MSPATRPAVDLEVVADDRSDTIVLLHSLALDRSVWGALVPDLSQRGAVVLLDLPGHGRSAPAPDATVESMADAVAGALRSLGREPATVIGLSLGGCVAQALTVRHPELVSALGLVDTTAWYGESAPQAWEERATKAAQDGLVSLAGFQLERWFSPDFLARRPEEGERLLKVFRSNDLDSYVATCRALGAVDLRRQIGGIAVPTAIVVGEHDMATPPTHAQAMAEAIPNASLVVLEDCRHLSAVERPEDVLAALEPILPARGQ